MKTVFYEALEARVAALGGMHNAHLHLDRAGTLAPYCWADAGADASRLAQASLPHKHASVALLHQGVAYTRDDLQARVNRYLDAMVKVNTQRADTVVDVTPDRVGLNAIQWLHEIKLQRRGQIDFRLGSYTPMGFRDDEPRRWDLVCEGLAFADFIGSLPERDDTTLHPGHIGFDEHLRRVLQLAHSTRKEVHVHLDQRHEASEAGTEALLRVLGELQVPPDLGHPPAVWAIHVISPSTYDEARFQALLDGLLEHHVGVICCPSAALGMRQLRPLRSPTGNSIARVLEMLAAGVHVRLGSDNIADICSPSTTPDLMDEVFLLSAALRFYDVDILARLAAGQALDRQERARVAEHLAQDRQEVARMVAASRGA